MQIASGHKLLDVGCGPGTDTIPLAQLVSPTGEVIGVDYDQAMLADAEQRAEKAGVSAWVHHKYADATAIPFATGYFDSCRSERLFQHLLDPKAVLAEMARVTKKDGWVVVLDTDWGSCAVDTPEVEIERRLMRFFVDETFHNGYSGRRLYRIFKEQGLADVAFELFPLTSTNYALTRLILSLDDKEPQALAAKIVTEDELRRWHESLEQADAEGLFFSYGCMMLVFGRKR
jgi:ubiquinone/menaquinone biosynthesis C-methylase UbiE